MAIDIEKLVLNSLKKISEENSFRRTALLNILHLNIDLLVKNAPTWFKGDIPEDYKRVTTSLMTLTTSFLQDDWDYRSKISDRKSELVEMAVLLRHVSDELNLLFGFEDSRISFEADENLMLRAPRKELTRAIFTILLAHYPYMSREFQCFIEVREDLSNIIISMNFMNLSQSFPGLDTIQKTFFTYGEGEGSRVGMGIDSALTILQESGARINFKMLPGGNNYGLIISYPSVNFLNTIDEIRRENAVEERKGEGGTVLMVTDDVITGLLLSELLRDQGFQVRSCDTAALQEADLFNDVRGIILDLSLFGKTALGEEIFMRMKTSLQYIVVLYSQDEEDLLQRFSAENIYPVKRPIDVERVLKVFDNRE